MFDKILYPTDGSDISLKALPYVRGLHGAGARQIILVHVIDDKSMDLMRKGMPFAGKDSAAFLARIHESLREGARRKVLPVAETLKEAGLDVSVRIETGSPRSKILEIADTEDVSAIVLGSHGRSNIAGMLLGSVADYVIRHARQPVIVIKREAGQSTRTDGQ